MPQDARKTALMILNRLGNEQTTLDSLIDDILNKHSNLSQKDRALANALVSGFLLMTPKPEHGASKRILSNVFSFFFANGACRSCTNGLTMDMPRRFISSSSRASFFLLLSIARILPWFFMSCARWAVFPPSPAHASST